MEINIENARAAFKTADESVKRVLLALLPELKEEEAQRAANRPITERVKTFEDACEVLGLSAEAMMDMWTDGGINASDEVAYQKLRLITTALNGGWAPSFTLDEERWYPWFNLWTDEELSDKNDEWKEAHALLSTEDYIGEWAGFAYANSSAAPSYTITDVGSRLCFKSEALATYCAKQFIRLWADLNLIKKGEEVIYE